MGKPVIAADRGMLSTIVDHNITGFVIDDTPENLATAIVKLAKDSELRSKMADASLKKAQDVFSQESMAEKVESVYKELLANKMRIRAVKLMKILIKIAIMGLVMTGLILINIKYMSNADGSEKDGQNISIERVVRPGINYTKPRREFTSLSTSVTSTVQSILGVCVLWFGVDMVLLKNLNITW